MNPTPLKQNEDARVVRVRRRHPKREYRLTLRFTPKVRVSQTLLYLSSVCVYVKNPLSELRGLKVFIILGKIK